jgi:hypothetical protein
VVGGATLIRMHHLVQPALRALGARRKDGQRTL